MLSLYSLLLLINLAIFWPAEIKWNVSTGNQINSVGILMGASFYKESVHVGWNTTIESIILANFVFKAQLSAIAPPKS